MLVYNGWGDNGGSKVLDYQENIIFIIHWTGNNVLL